MYRLRTFALALVLSLAGAVYAAGGPQFSAQSCGLHQAGCRVEGATCCTGEACCTAQQVQ